MVAGEIDLVPNSELVTSHVIQGACAESFKKGDVFFDVNGDRCPGKQGNQERQAPSRASAVWILSENN